MIKIFSLLLAYFMAMWNGVPYIEPDDKPFIQESYYKTQTTGFPDDRNLYNNTIAKMVSADQNSDLTPYPFDTSSGRSIFGVGSNNGYFPFALPKGSDVKNIISGAKRIKINSDNYYVFSVPKGTELVAPFNCTLDNASTVVGTVYPKNELVPGVSMTVETEKLASGDIFKITYGSMNRMWLNMRKQKPDDYYDNDQNKPLYYLSENLNSKISFNQKDVVGEAGLTGVPALSYTGEAYVLLRVQKYMNGSYKECKLEELLSITS